MFKELIGWLNTDAEFRNYMLKLWNNILTSICLLSNYFSNYEVIHSFLKLFVSVWHFKSPSEMDKVLFLIICGLIKSKKIQFKSNLD